MCHYFWQCCQIERKSKEFAIWPLLKLFFLLMTLFPIDSFFYCLAGRPEKRIGLFSGELFLFSEILVNNRDKLKESESFILTLQKDKIINESTKKRINVRKILRLDEVINNLFSNVTIELSENFNINEIKEILSTKGETTVNLIIKNKNQIVNYSLQNNRKFDLKLFKALKAKNYVEKITV